MRLSQALLSSLGLSDAEGKVYLAALELGEASVQDLARKSGVRRTSIYSFLDRLKQQQVLSETKKGKRSVYTAAHPAQLLETLRMRVREYDRVLPELMALHNQSRTKPSVTFYDGVSGIKEVYADALSEGKPIYAWIDWEHLIPVMGEPFLDDYPSERASRGIPLHQISRDSRAAREVATRDQEELRTTKFLEVDHLKTEIMIYGDKVAIMSFRISTPFGLIINDAGTAATLRVGWKELWNRL